MSAWRLAGMALLLVGACGRPAKKQGAEQRPADAAMAKASAKSPSERTAENILVLDAALKKGERELAEMERTGAPPEQTREQRDKVDAVRQTLERERARMRILDEQAR